MEFDLIRKFFSDPFSVLSLSNQSRILVGIGDDCAVLTQNPNKNLYISTDTSVEGVHFFTDEDPWSVGWKSLAVNLSDLAASGAKPLAFTLNLSLPRVDQDWLAAFSSGLLGQAQLANCPLVGGDTTSTQSGSPLVVSITVFGERPSEANNLTRSAAKTGDEIWVTSIPGLARLGLLQRFDRRGKLPSVLNNASVEVFRMLWAALPESIRTQALARLTRPVIRSQFALDASAHMHAVLDLSDGLSGDLQHIAHASQKTLLLQADLIQKMWCDLLEVDLIYSNPAFLPFLIETTLVGGDDYELCFTSNPNQSKKIIEIARSLQIPLAELGQVQASESLEHRVVIQDAQGIKTALRSSSFNHFGQ